MSEQIERWTIKTCPRCGGLVEGEWTYDGAMDVCTNSRCKAYGPFAENPEPLEVEVVAAPKDAA